MHTIVDKIDSRVTTLLTISDIGMLGSEADHLGMEALVEVSDGFTVVPSPPL